MSDEDDYKKWPPIDDDLQYEIARRVLHFNDGWEEVHVVLEHLGLSYAVEVEEVRRFDEDPEHLPRVVSRLVLGPDQALGVLKFLEEQQSRLREDSVESDSESKMTDLEQARQEATARTTNAWKASAKIAEDRVKELDLELGTEQALVKRLERDMKGWEAFKAKAKIAETERDSLKTKLDDLIRMYNALTQKYVMLMGY